MSEMSGGEARPSGPSPNGGSPNGADPLPVGVLGTYFFLASEAMFFVGLLGSFVVLESAGDQHSLFVQSSTMLSRWIVLGSVVLLIASSAILSRKTWAAIGAGGLVLLLLMLQWKLLLPANGPQANNFFGCYFLFSAVHGLHLLAGMLVVGWFAIVSQKKLPHSVQIYWHFVNAVGVISGFCLILRLMSEDILSIANLTYSYGQRVALDGLSLSVRRGEIFGFLGPNGSGKTTLFRILSTLIPAPVNAVKLFGLDASVELNNIRRRIGVVFQSPSLDKQLTAEENLRHHGHLYGMHGSDLENRIQIQLKKVGLLERAKERVDGFSGGMRRRVELAKGLLNQPEILLLDEPSTGLDPSARIDLWQSLLEIQASGV